MCDCSSDAGGVLGLALERLGNVVDIEKVSSSLASRRQTAGGVTCPCSRRGFGSPRLAQDRSYPKRDAEVKYRISFVELDAKTRAFYAT